MVALGAPADLSSLHPDEVTDVFGDTPSVRPHLLKFASRVAAHAARMGPTTRSPVEQAAHTAQNAHASLIEVLRVTTAPLAACRELQGSTVRLLMVERRCRSGAQSGSVARRRIAERTRSTQ